MGGTLGVAVIGTSVLGVRHAGASEATAITVGFLLAAGAFGAALLVGLRLLSRLPLGPDDDVEGGAPVTPAAPSG